MNNLPPPIYICATSRLARGMQLRAQVDYVQTKQAIWQSVEAYTLSHWLSQTLEAAMMLGQVPISAMPAKLLNGFSETHLWELAITQCLEKHEASALFDVKSLAKTAMSAHQTLIEWQVPERAISEGVMSQETRQFLRWRQKFLALCQDKKSCDASRYLATQIDLICQFDLSLPTQLIFAGFDRITPLIQHLVDSLKARNVSISFENATKSNENAIKPTIHYVGMQNEEDECRAVVAWAKAQLSHNPAAQIAIISPTLSDERRYLTDLLDDVFHPDTILPNRYEAPRIYDFSLGLALSDYPIIHCALQLLRLVASLQNKPYSTVTPILHDVYWGDIAELSQRARLDAYLRQKVSATVSLNAIAQLAEAQFNQELAGIDEVAATDDSALNPPNYLQSLQYLTYFQQHQIQSPKKLASEWLTLFIALLTKLNWANTRSLSSIEYQTQQRFLETIQTLAQQDYVLGLISAQECLNALLAMCQQTMFQAEAVGDVHIQLLGLLETPALGLDAVWVMHMNDQHWPPPVKLNPLLPVKLQRELGLPNASSAVQTQFARIVQTRVNQMAKEIIFSYALTSHDQVLRPSTLLNVIASFENACTYENAHESHDGILSAQMPLFTRLSESIAQASALEYLDDHIATNINENDILRGGTQLFKRQAVCPAWAFYQHRLGAKALATPTEGLESKDHGNLLHMALEQFWLRCSGSIALKSMANDMLDAAILDAIKQAMRRWQEKTKLQVSAQILTIECARMHALMSDYLAFEKTRTDFIVEACEKEAKHTIAGIPLTLTIDRIDCLINDDFNGHTVIMDYKTGSQVSHASWALPRITEPQLPIYATLALQQGTEVAAVYFAKLSTQELTMRGLAMSKAIVPGLTGFDALRSNSPFTQFDGWAGLLAAWDSALINIGEEIKRGEARVSFQKLSDLAYCEVLPLLRLPERAHQFEEMQPSRAIQPNIEKSIEQSGHA